MKKWVYMGLLAQALTMTSFNYSDDSFPESMAALGDSISAGALARYSRTDAKNPLIDLAILFKLAGVFMSKNVRFIEDRNFTWTLGMDSKLRMISHARRLSFMKGHKINTYNAAVSGNESADLQDQFDRLLKWSYKNNNGKFPDYVTILIGANDICADSTEQMINPGVFENNVDTIIKEIHEENPNTKVLISSLPNIESLRNVAKDSPLMGRGPFSSCQDFWKRASACGTLTLLDDPYERSKVSLRVKEYNHILQKLAGVADGISIQNSDNNVQSNPNVKFGSKVYDVQFTPNDLSLDCFHPNPNGQNLISENSWKSSWWYSEWQSHYAKRFEDYVKKEKRKIALAEQRAREQAQRMGRAGSKL